MFNPQICVILILQVPHPPPQTLTDAWDMVGVLNPGRKVGMASRFVVVMVVRV